jgi:hypothetical protein
MYTFSKYVSHLHCGQFYISLRRWRSSWFSIQYKYTNGLTRLSCTLCVSLFNQLRRRLFMYYFHIFQYQTITSGGDSLSFTIETHSMYILKNHPIASNESLQLNHFQNAFNIHISLKVLH